MKHILNDIQKNLFWWIFGAVMLGLFSVKIFGGYAFTSAICLLAALVMIYPSLVPLDFAKLKYAHKDSGIIALSLLLNFIVAPAVAFFLGYVFLQNQPALWAGLMLISLLPGGGMATTWALKSKADMPAVIGIIFSNLIAAIFIFPAALSFILEKFSQAQSTIIARSSSNATCPISSATNGALSCGSSTPGEISPLKIIVPIVFIIVIPLILAYLTQTIIIKKKGAAYFDDIKSFFAKFSNLGMILVLLVLMGLKSNAVIFAHPEMIIISILPLMLFYLIQFFILITIYRKFFNDPKGKSLVWGSYLRYITLALGMATSLIYQTPTLSVLIIIVILAYFIQIPTSFLIAKHLNRK